MKLKMNNGAEMNDNKHIVELSECNDCRSVLRKSIMTITLWIIGGIATLTFAMYGMLYNKLDNFIKDYTISQYVIQKHIGTVNSDINNIDRQLERLLNLSNKNKQSKGTIVYEKPNICDSEGDG